MRGLLILMSILCVVPALAQQGNQPAVGQSIESLRTRCSKKVIVWSTEGGKIGERPDDLLFGRTQGVFDVRKKKQLEFWPDLPTVIDPRKRYERYWTYITKSPRWKAIAEKTKRLAKYQCIYCGPTCQGTINLQAHHRNYDNLYRETPGVDVECVCGNCHEYITFLQADNDNEPGS